MRRHQDLKYVPEPCLIAQFTTHTSSISGHFLAVPHKKWLLQSLTVLFFCCAHHVPVFHLRCFHSHCLYCGFPYYLKSLWLSLIHIFSHYQKSRKWTSCGYSLTGRTGAIHSKNLPWNLGSEKVRIIIFS